MLGGFAEREGVIDGCSEKCMLLDFGSIKPGMIGIGSTWKQNEIALSPLCPYLLGEGEPIHQAAACKRRHEEVQNCRHLFWKKVASLQVSDG
jgi:hypothetical protein